MSLTPKNWSSFQHYKNRSPAWIKLHRGLLDDFAFSRLPVASRALAPLLWLLASDHDDGKITGSLEEIAFRLHMTEADLREAVKPLIDAGFFIDDSNALAECKHAAIPEREKEEQVKIEEEREEKERSLRSRSTDVSRETSDWPANYRDLFWEAYPRKKAKKAAFKVLDRIRKSGEVTFDRLMAAILKIPIGEPVFIPHPATWLNQGRWDDEQLPGETNGRAFQQAGNVIAAADRLVERIAQFERPDGNTGVRSIEGETNVRLLSPG